ncbi:MAG: PEP-CTERM sorting domain-containing protein [Fimbriimonadia bacterium]
MRPMLGMGSVVLAPILLFSTTLADQPVYTSSRGLPLDPFDMSKGVITYSVTTSWEFDGGVSNPTIVEGEALGFTWEIRFSISQRGGAGFIPAIVLRMPDGVYTPGAPVWGQNGECWLAVMGDAVFDYDLPWTVESDNGLGVDQELSVGPGEMMGEMWAIAHAETVYDPRGLEYCRNFYGDGGWIRVRGWIRGMRMPDMPMHEHFVIDGMWGHIEPHGMWGEGQRCFPTGIVPDPDASTAPWEGGTLWAHGGKGYTDNMAWRSFNVVPEPGSLAILCLGFAALGLRGRKHDTSGTRGTEPMA